MNGNWSFLLTSSGRGEGNEWRVGNVTTATANCHWSNQLQRFASAVNSFGNLWMNYCTENIVARAASSALPPMGKSRTATSTVSERTNTLPLPPPLDACAGMANPLWNGLLQPPPSITIILQPRSTRRRATMHAMKQSMEVKGKEMLIDIERL